MPGNPKNGYRKLTIERPPLLTKKGRTLREARTDEFQVRRKSNYMVVWQCGVCANYVLQSESAAGGFCPGDCETAAPFNRAKLRRRRVWMCDDNYDLLAFSNYDEYIRHFEYSHAGLFDSDTCDYQIV